MKKWTVFSAVMIYCGCCCGAVQTSNDTIKQSLDKFKRDYYSGSEAQGIVRIYYNQTVSAEKPWKRQPNICYGILINWQKAVVPCSCVGYPKNDEDIRSPTIAPNSSTRAQLVVVDKDHIRVGIMIDEQDAEKNTSNIVNVKDIKLHPKCDSYYNVNYATLDLTERIRGSKLMWVNEAVKELLASEIEGVAVASAVSGSCYFFRWKKVGKKDTSSVSRVGNSTVKPDRIQIFFSNWDSCMINVCPLYHQLGKDGYCTNEMEGKRWCMHSSETEKLCRLPEGTPVFCHVRNYRGVMGLLYHTPFYCGKNNNLHSSILASFEDALDMVDRDLPLVHYPKYLEKLPPGYAEYLTAPRTELEKENGASTFDVFHIIPMFAGFITLIN